MPRQLLLLAVLFGSLIAIAATAADRPNIVWLSTEDISPHLGFMGDPHAITPHLDQLAHEGVVFNRTYTSAGVCAPVRSAIITGMYQSTIGTQHMRSAARLPAHIKLFPSFLKNAGYYTSNNSKTDYQLPDNDPVLDGVWDDSSRKGHWRNRPHSDQPFFAVFNFDGTHESGIASEAKYTEVTANLTADQRQDPAALTTYPPYYPETPNARENWKRNYELITAMDTWAGDLIQQLKDDGLYENTIIFFWSDHGIGLPRGKRWLYESGTHVPLAIRVPAAYRTPGQITPGTIDSRLISSIDFAPTVLNLAGVDLPAQFQGQPFLGPNRPAPRDYIYGARDRMDERYDIIRMVRDQRFRYIRNYEPLKSYYQYMNTPEKGTTMADLRRLHDAGNLSPIPDSYFAPRKPTEELYDVSADPHEINNLASDPTYAPTLERLREVHLQWVRDTRDTGLIPEPILVTEAQRLGSRYDILRQTTDATFSTRLAHIANQASTGPDALPELVAALKDSQPSIRYWGAIGLGNIGAPAANSTAPQLTAALDDDSVIVRVAAARALCRLDQPAKALPILTAVLADGAQWERLHAANVLDEIDEQARPVVRAMHAALEPRPDLEQNGKYVIRVINRALNQLEGTKRMVR
jgi:arylsulfatase A-like enzyme